MSVGARLIIVSALVAGLGGQAAAAQAAQAPVTAQPARGLVVAVPDFYAPGVLPPLEGVFPRQAAADDLTTLLTQQAGGRFRVVPRQTVREAESAMGWQESDVLHFARLQELGRAVGASRLLVGWIERVDLGGFAGFDVAARLGSPFATIRVQVFDVPQGRIITQRQQSEFGPPSGLLRGEGVKITLRDLLSRIVPSLLPSL